MLAGVDLWIWGLFMLFVFGMLALDLGVFHREAHVVSMREAMVWSGVWIGLALVFNAGLYAFWDSLINADASAGLPAYTSAEAAMAFLAGYLVEKALSVDNIFVFLIIFAYFKVPRELQHRVLFYGIIGALIFRALFIAMGAAVLEHFFWSMLIFGGFLIFTGIRMALDKGKEVDPGKNPLVRAFTRVVPVTKDYVGQQFFTKIDGQLWATPLFLSLLVIEITDIIFAVDSIPAIFAITSHPFIVFTSNIFAILGLRALFFALAGLMQMFHYLHYGLAAILVFVGGKMFYAYAEKAVWPELSKFPVHWSLAIIALLLTASIAASLIWPDKKKLHEQSL